MKPILRNALLLLFVCVTGSIKATAQTNEFYRYQDLSHLYYGKQKDSLKKAWTCPVVYKDKDVQKKYKEIWDGRTEFFLEAIQQDNYVHDKEVSAYVQSVVDELVKANAAYFPVRPMVFIDRSPSVNAYAIGSNILAVNLGLITFARTKEELALTIAHELSHNVLQHAENAMKKRAEWLTSDEYRESLNNILDSKYERLTRLKKIYENYSFNRSRHQRYHEEDADSMAIILLTNSKISIDPKFFLRLDSVDYIYKQPLKLAIKDYFSPYNVQVDEAWQKKRSKGLSTRNYAFQDNNAMADSLKTHPDCEIRYDHTRKYATTNLAGTPIPVAISEKAEKMLIWNMYCNMNVTPCLYRILKEKDNGNKDEWYDFMLHNIILTLYRADMQLHRFNAIGVTQKEYISKDYYELQTLLEQIPREKLEESCKTMQIAGFWSKMPASEQDMKTLLDALIVRNDEQAIADERAGKAFIRKNNSSLYCEFAHTFDITKTDK